MSEVWKDVPGLEGRYQVSNLGRVKSLSRTEPHKLHGIWHIRERILKATDPYKTKRGYSSVGIRDGNGKLISPAVHRLVAICFVPNPLNLPEVNHIDGNRANNAASNLEWVTRKENMHHAWKTGLCDPIVKAKVRAVVNVDTGERFDSVADAERHYGKSVGGISHVLNGICERAHGYRWKYEEE